MIFQVIVIRITVCQVDVPFFCQQQFLGAVFIDHVSAVVCCSGCTVCYMYRAEFSSISGVQVSDGIAITERNYLGQK